MTNIEQPENLKIYAHVANGKVVNVSVWAETPEDKSLVKIPEGSPAGIGWDYIDGEFVDNRPKPEIPTI